MRLSRRLSEEERAWQEVRALWDATVGELKVKVDRAQARADEEGNDDDQR